MPKNITLVLLLICFMGLSCNLLSENQITAEKSKETNAEKPKETSKSGAKRNDASFDKGDFKVGSAAAKNSKNRRAFKKVEANVKEVMQPLADELNNLFALPFDVFMRYDECGEPNAFYDREKKEIIMCYELVDDFYEMFKPDYKKQADLENAVDGAIAFTFFHELGHALIDVWDLPTTGREEDAVDQLSTLILSDGTPQGKDTVINGAYSFGLVDDGGDSGELAFWDEHSFNQQRFYNILCLLYGQDPKSNEDLVGKNGLPEERAAICVDEFTRADKAWTTLLAPYVKN